MSSPSPSTNTLYEIIGRLTVQNQSLDSVIAELRSELSDKANYIASLESRIEEYHIQEEEEEEENYIRYLQGQVADAANCCKPLERQVADCFECRPRDGCAESRWNFDFANHWGNRPNDFELPNENLEIPEENIVLTPPRFERQTHSEFTRRLTMEDLATPADNNV